MISCEARSSKDSNKKKGPLKIALDNAYVRSLNSEAVWL